MRLSRTSLIYFLSTVTKTVIGVLVTIYLARVLGAEVLGSYFVVLATVVWLKIPSDAVGLAINKRVSEGDRREEILSAGFVLTVVWAAFVSLAIFTFDNQVNDHIGTAVALLLIPLVFVDTFYFSVLNGVRGQKKVATSGILEAGNKLIISAVQIGLVFAGYEIVALLVGDIVGLMAAAVIGLLLYDASVGRPVREDFVRLLRFARYSWMGNIRGRTFGWMDVILLSFFVGNALVGVYEIAWRVASMAIIVELSLRRTLFPEISDLSTDDDYDKIKELLRESLTFVGIFSIPGLFGALVVGEDLLGLYGAEFRKGTVILVILIAARAVNAYGKQMENTLNAVNRPDISFKINSIFILSNIVLNLVLISVFGWIGAAVGTAVSSVLLLVLSYHFISRAIGRPPLPARDIALQVGASVVMAMIVWSFEGTLPFTRNVATIVLVGIGGVAYFAILFALSGTIRDRLLSLL